MTKRVIIELEFEDGTDIVSWDVARYLEELIADNNLSYQIINEDIPSETYNFFSNFIADERELYIGELIEGIPCDVCGETTTAGKTSCLRTQFSTTQCPYHMLNVVGEIK